MLKMKIKLFSIFLLCGISCEETLQSQRNEYFDNFVDFQETDDYYRNGDIENRYGYNKNNDDRYYDKEYIGNPDFDAIIERPCRVFDLNCIRRYFAEHSKCKIRRGPLPERLFFSQQSLYFSRVNLTATPVNYIVNGFRNTRIEEFYINRRTNKMVFSIQIRGFTESATNIYFQFFRANREPIVIAAKGLQSYPSVTFTAIIPNIDDIQLKEAEVTAFSDSIPVFFLGPALLLNTDPTVTQAVVEILADTPTDTQESFLADSLPYLPAYIQINICDFDPTVGQTLVAFLADTPTGTQESFLTDSQPYLPAYIQLNICDFGLLIQ